jgi:molecular chaperone HtpG
MLNLPLEFNSILQKDTKLSVIVTETILDFSELLEENKLFFFEEYTNHGIAHVQSLFNTCKDLIGQSTMQNLMKPIDVCVLALSIVIHDVGMHVSPEIFQILLQGGFDEYRIPDLDEKTWTEMWMDYIVEIKKSDEETIKKVFGENCIQLKIPNISQLNTLDSYDRKFIGEFLRRNHPRLAHEIALAGYIGPNGKIEFARGLNNDIKGIIGLTARSHGLSIRSLFNYIRNEYPSNWMTPYQIHLIYLMILLRVGDILQIDSNRIPSYIFKLHNFDSVISYEEFLKHNSIQDFSPLFFDKETLVVSCNPPNAKIFKALRDLFQLIQRELDTSWAILGEIYGSKPDNERPVLTRRRIQSNIDDIKKFSKSVNYVPEFISLEIEPNLIKLLIAPLYGNNPSYGIRELIQNAADACNERKVLDKKNKLCYIPKISIRIFMEREEYFLEITDNGKGMNVQEIKNFFFRIGSSYRYSEEWKKEFITENNKSILPRIGKFGVGVLAGFLLGNSMNVTTKRYDESIGYNFDFDLQSKNVELIKDKTQHIGTRIKVKLKKEIVNELCDTSSKVKGHINKFESQDKGFVRYSRINYTWDLWYTLDTPELTIKFLSDGEYKPYNPGNPGYNSKVPVEWCTFDHEDFEKILWTYSDKFTQGKLVVNGIVIPRGYKIYSNYIYYAPFLSIFDLNGSLNLLLNRYAIEKDFVPFNDLLRLEIYKHLLSRILITEIKTFSILIDTKLSTGFSDISHPAFRRNFRILHNSKGFILNMTIFFKKYQHVRYKMSTNIINEIEYKSMDEDYFIVQKDTSDNKFPFIDQKNEDDKLNFSSIEHEDYKFDYVELGEESTQLYEFFLNVLGEDWIIPFDINERKKKFSRAFTLLSAYIKNNIAIT